MPIRRSEMAIKANEMYKNGEPPLEVINEIIEKRANGLPLKMICGALAISTGRLERWMNQGEQDIDDGVDSAYARLYVGLAKSESMIAERCMAGILKAGEVEGGRNWQALAWIMERCFPEEYGMAKRAEVGGSKSPVRVVMGDGSGGSGVLPQRSIGVVNVPAQTAEPAQSTSKGKRGRPRKTDVDARKLG